MKINVFFPPKALIDDCVFTGEFGGLDYVVEGFDQLPRSLFRRLETNVRFRSKVASVRKVANGTRIQVSISCNGCDCNEGKWE